MKHKILAVIITSVGISLAFATDSANAASTTAYICERDNKPTLLTNIKPSDCDKLIVKNYTFKEPKRKGIRRSEKEWLIHLERSN